MDIDHLLIGGGIDVAVGSQGRTEMAGPAASRPDRLKEPLDVDGHGRGRPAREYTLEMLARQIVVALEIERSCQFEPHAHQSGPVDQNRVECGDCLAEIRGSFRSCDFRNLRCTQRGQADEKQYVRAIRVRWR